VVVEEVDENCRDMLRRRRLFGWWEANVERVARRGRSAVDGTGPEPDCDEDSDSLPESDSESLLKL